MPPNVYSLLLASMSSGQGMPFPPQLLAGFPGMQTGGMGFLGPVSNPASLQSLLPAELTQHFQQVGKYILNSEKQASHQNITEMHLLRHSPLPSCASLLGLSTIKSSAKFPAGHVLVIFLVVNIEGILGFHAHRCYRLSSLLLIKSCQAFRKGKRSK